VIGGGVPTIELGIEVLLDEELVVVLLEEASESERSCDRVM
jgi:hypothetical protein